MFLHSLSLPLISPLLVPFLSLSLFLPLSLRFSLALFSFFLHALSRALSLSLRLSLPNLSYPPSLSPSPSSDTTDTYSGRVRIHAVFTEHLVSLGCHGVPRRTLVEDSLGVSPVRSRTRRHTDLQDRLKDVETVILIWYSQTCLKRSTNIIKKSIEGQGK